MQKIHSNMSQIYLVFIFFLLSIVSVQNEELEQINGVDISPNILNPHEFKYILNPGRKICGESLGKEVFLLVVVNTDPTKFARRFSLRETWSRRSMFRDVRIVYLMGIGKTAKINQKIKLENGIYGDIIQENFMDTYKNLTYKGIMSLKWIKEYCPHVKYILKCDDDVLVNSVQLLRYLWSLKSNNSIYCNVLENMSVIRNKRSKWYISELEYKPNKFPPYCSGAAYVLTSDLVDKMYNLSFHVKFVWIDDFFMTGILGAGTNVSLVSLNNFYEFSHNSRKKEAIFRSKRKDSLIFTHSPENPKNVFKYWDFILINELSKDLRLIVDNASLIHRNDFNYLDLFNWAYANFWSKFKDLNSSN